MAWGKGHGWGKQGRDGVNWSHARFKAAGFLYAGRAQPNWLRGEKFLRVSRKYEDLKTQI